MTKPSGSFVLWDNTICNPLAPAREQARSAWEDGYASGVAAEREKFIDMLRMAHDSYALASDPGQLKERGTR